jgi:diguanylate cyclase (GGDEF)-like protein
MIGTVEELLGLSSPSPETDNEGSVETILGLNSQSPPSYNQSPEMFDLDTLVMKHSEENGVDPELVKAVIGQESAGNPSAVSPKGASGLMQIMPGTGRSIASKLGDTFDEQKLHEPDTNIRYGTTLLSELLKKYNGSIPLVLADYHGGPSAVLPDGTINPKSNDGRVFTTDYVAQVMGRMGNTTLPALSVSGISESSAGSVEELLGLGEPQPSGIKENVEFAQPEPLLEIGIIEKGKLVLGKIIDESAKGFLNFAELARRASGMTYLDPEREKQYRKDFAELLVDIDENTTKEQQRQIDDMGLAGKLAIEGGALLTQIPIFELAGGGGIAAVKGLLSKIPLKSLTKILPALEKVNPSVYKTAIEALGDMTGFGALGAGEAAVTGQNMGQAALRNAAMVGPAKILGPVASALTKEAAPIIQKVAQVASGAAGFAGGTAAAGGTPEEILSGAILGAGMGALAKRQKPDLLETALAGEAAKGGVKTPQPESDILKNAPDKAIEMPKENIDLTTGIQNSNTIRPKVEAAGKDPSKDVLIFDIDDFKAVNDTYGHDEGDNVLRGVGSSVQAHFPDAEFGRIGGEEFAVILNKGQHEQAKEFLNSLPDEVKVKGASITVSGGIGDNLKQADDALNQMKRTGKNQISVDNGASAPYTIQGKQVGDKPYVTDTDLRQIEQRARRLLATGKVQTPEDRSALERAIQAVNGIRSDIQGKPRTDLPGAEDLSLQGKGPGRGEGIPEEANKELQAINAPADEYLPSKLDNYLLDKTHEEVTSLLEPANAVTGKHAVEMKDIPEYARPFVIEQRVGNHANDLNAQREKDIESLQSDIEQNLKLYEAANYLKNNPMKKESLAQAGDKNFAQDLGRFSSPTGKNVDEMRKRFVSRYEKTLSDLGTSADKMQTPSEFLEFIRTLPTEKTINEQRSVLKNLTKDSKDIDSQVSDYRKSLEAEAAAAVPAKKPIDFTQAEMAGLEDPHSVTQKAIETEKAFREQQAKAAGAGTEGTPLFEKEQQASEQTSLFARGASVGDYANRNDPTPPLVETPELVEMAGKLANGESPKVLEKLRAAGGQARGTASGRNIKLRADLGKDPEQLAKTLAHEIGHVAQHVTGKIGTLFKYLKATLFVEPVNIDENFKLSGGLISQRDVKNELKAVSAEWRPWDESIAGFKEKKYRNSYDELHADAFSVLMNEPELLKQKAPHFYELLMSHIDKNPEVKGIYDELTNRTQQGQDAVLANRQERIFSGYEEKETQRKSEAVKKDAEIKAKKTGLARGVYRSLIEKYDIIEHAVNAAKKMGIEITDDRNPFLGARSQKYVSGQQHVYQQGALEAESKAKIKGADDWNNNSVRKYIGAFMQMKQQAGRLSDKMAPQGIQGKFAQEQLDYMRKDLGKERSGKIEEAVNAYFDLRKKEIIPVLTEGAYPDTFSPELTKTIKENTEYSRREIVKDFEEKYGSNASASLLGMKSVKGTLRAIGNPFVETVVYDSGLLRAKAKSDFVRSTVELFRDNQGKENIVSHIKVEPAETENLKGIIRFKHVDGEMKTVYYLKDGELQGYNVSKELADLLNTDLPHADGILGFLRSVGDIQRAVFVKYSLPFLLRNPFRDIAGSIKNIPQYGVVSGPFRTLQYAFKTFPEVWNYVQTGKMSSGLADAFREGAIPIQRNFESEKILEGKDELERQIATFEGKPNEYKEWHNRVLEKVSSFFEAFGQLEEKSRKYADYTFIKEKHPEISKEARAQLIRTQSGTPDVFAGGTSKPLTNQLFIFSSVNMQGQRAAWDAFKTDPKRYLLKLALYDIAPKAFMYAAGAGGAAWLAHNLGINDAAAKWLEDAYKMIPSHHKAKYYCIPLPMRTESGQQVYFSIPSDYSGQLIGATLWRMVHAGEPKGTQNLAKELLSVSPLGTASLQPTVELAAGYAQYLTQGNIYDSFTGGMVIPQDVVGAGPVRELPLVAKWTYDQVGGSTVWKMPDNFDFRAKGALENAFGIPMVGPALGAFLKVSDRGISEEIKNERLKAQNEQKNISLDVKDVITNNIQEKGITTELHPLFQEAKAAGYSGRFGVFKTKYRELAIKKLGDQETKEIAAATSLKERAAAINKILDNKKLTGTERAKEKRRLSKKTNLFKAILREQVED